MLSESLPSALQPLVRRFVLPLASSPLGDRLVRGAFWSLIGTLASRALTAVSSIFVARILGKTGFGEFGIIQSTLGMFGVFAGFGLGMTATKYVAEFRDKDPSKAGRILAISTVFAIVSSGFVCILIVVCSSWVSARLLAAPHLSDLLKIGAGILFFSAVSGVQTGSLAGFEAFKAMARINILIGVATLPLMITGVYFFDLKGAVWALLVITVWNCSLNRIALKHEAKRSGVPLSLAGSSAADWKVLWRFSMPALLSASMVGPINWVCNALLVNQPDGYAEMGVLNAANQWYNLILFLPLILSRVNMPMLSNKLGKGDKENSKQILKRSLKMIAFSVFPLVIAGAILSPWIMQLYGDSFRGEWMVLVVALLTAGILSILSPVGDVIAASGRMWTGFVMNIGWACIFIFISWLLLDFGALGLSISRGVSYTVHASWTFMFAYHYMKGIATGAQR